MYLYQVFVDGKMVERECSGFITAENIHSCHLLNGCHPFGDGTLQSSEQIQ
jgi:hypothetical protein